MQRNYFVLAFLWSTKLGRIVKMSVTIGNSLRSSSPLKVKEETKVIEKQGIVSILGSDSEQYKAASLRRTLSADMSSRKWLAQNGFSPMKKNASSEELAISVASSCSEGEKEYEGKNELERPGQADVWSPIQSQKMELEKPGQFDIWSSILSHKTNDDSSNLPPPYIHPLVKRSVSSLSKKSLEICTESLGSETGSDSLSSYALSDTSDVEEEKEEVEPQPESESQSQSSETEELKYNYTTSKKLPPRSFPPPLPFLARCDGPSLHMHSHRENGRLVLEAVSVPSQNYFHAQRQDGRLVLTFADEPIHEEMIDQEEEMIDQKADDVDEIEEMFQTFTEERDDEAEKDEEMVENFENGHGHGAKEIGIVMEQASKLSSGMLNVHSSALMIKKLMGLDNRKPTWTYKFNKAVNMLEMEMEEEEGPTPLPQSLPQPPQVGRLIPSQRAKMAASSFNAYEYFWRTKPIVTTTVINPSSQQCSLIKNNCNNVILSSSAKAYEQQEMVLFGGNKTDFLVPLLRGCKEPARRSSLIWELEPCCIATS